MMAVLFEIGGVDQDSALHPIMSSDYKELETISKARYDEKSTCNGNKLSDPFVQRGGAAKRGNHCNVASLDRDYEKLRLDSVNEPALL
ncbi:hypothetical protein TNCV_1823711 [Trichonephila clavipes]|nr:hypothetical protein TNCV_1823711 [Trichonephila clavipes]